MDKENAYKQMKADKLIKISKDFTQRCFLKFEHFFLADKSEAKGSKVRKDSVSSGSQFSYFDDKRTVSFQSDRVN